VDLVSAGIDHGVDLVEGLCDAVLRVQAPAEIRGALAHGGGVHGDRSRQ
jgi:hypothetical protein